ncbi:hypothetical protein G3N96_23280 [Burkholderia sp. Se-20373]|nr:hypothetical protein [Burkholderia sp. Se-20373]
MTIFLDEPFDDEPLFGVVARYLESSPPQALGSTIARLFGRIIRASYVSSGLNYVARETQSCWGLSPEQIAKNLTAFPYFAATLLPERSQLLLERMCGLFPAGVRKRHTIAAWNLAWYGHRFCRACFREDTLTEGIAHWRRSHQLPGVVVCHLHGELLWELNKHAGDKALGYVSPSAAIRLGVSPIYINLTAYQRRNCQKFAQISADLLNENFSIDILKFRLEFRDFMRRKSCYLSGERQHECMDRLILQCFGADYVRKYRILRKCSPFFDALCDGPLRNPTKIVVALSLMRLVEEAPELISDQRFEDIYNYCKPKKSRMWKSPRGLPKFTCPSQFSSHEPGHLIPKVYRYRGRVRAACDCGFKFTCVEVEGRVTSIRIADWGPDYRDEVCRLGAAGMKPRTIARRIGMSEHTVNTILWRNSRTRST